MLTNKGKYGLKAMTYLAGVETGRPSLVAEIAAENNIPKQFLDAILAELRNAGIVRSKKGRGGGYELARPPEEIRVGQIVRVLDGPLAPIRCASPNYYEKCLDCEVEKQCPVHLMMFEVRNAIASILDNRTLAELRNLPGFRRKASPGVDAVRSRSRDRSGTATTRPPNRKAVKAVKEKKTSSLKTKTTSARRGPR